MWNLREEILLFKSKGRNKHLGSNVATKRLKTIEQKYKKKRNKTQQKEKGNEEMMDNNKGRANKKK